MSDYIINFTDPAKGSFVIRPSTTNGPASPIAPTPLDPQATSANTSVVLLGKGMNEYGERVAETLVHMLEHFAYESRPAYAIQGQIWFKNVDFADPSNPSDPTIAGTYIYDGTDWQLVLSSVGGSVDVSGYTLANVNTPVNPNDATTKQYVDDEIATAVSGAVTSFNGRTGAVTLTSLDVTDALTYTPVNVAGDTMTGTLVLNADPVNGLDAATKQYVDTEIAAGVGGAVTSFNTRTGAVTLTSLDVTDALTYTPVNVAGDTMTGPLLLSGNPTTTLEAATKQYVDLLSVSSFNGRQGPVFLLSTDVTAVLGFDKTYVDSLVSGIQYKQAARVSSTVDVPLLSPPAAIDGVTLNSGDRILLMGQTAPEENGLYEYDSVELIRTEDADSDFEVMAGMTVFVSEGTVNADTSWVLITNDPIQVDVTPLSFAQISSAGQIIAGNGLTRTGNTMNVGTASATRIVVNADNIDLATTGVSAGTYTKVTVDTYGRVTTGAQINSADVITALGYTPTNKAGDTISGVLTVAGSLSNYVQFQDNAMLYIGTGGNGRMWSSPTNDNVYLDLAGGGTNDFYIRGTGFANLISLSKTTGDLTAAGNVTAYSDSRLKKDVEPIRDALDKVKQLSGYTFTRTDIDTNTRKTGVIAQEVQQVLPEAVTQDQDGYMSVAYGNMVGLLIEAIKQLDEKLTRVEDILNNQVD